MNEKENWRGKGNEREEPPRNIGKKRKTKYLTPTPDWDSANMLTQIGIPVFQNGSLCDPIYLRGKNVIVKKTCALDSWIQIIINSIAIHATYKQKIFKFNIPVFHLAENALQKGKLTVDMYKQRATILLEISSKVESIFQHTKTRKVHTLNAKCNAAH